MEFQITVKRISDGKVWDENYDCIAKDVYSDEEAIEWGKKLVDWFNSDLRPNESPREFISAKLLGDADGKRLIPHQWDKTNIVTIMRRGALYDTYKCTKCGITGKRYGLDNITRDRKYKAAKYAFCKG